MAGGATRRKKFVQRRDHALDCEAIRALIGVCNCSCGQDKKDGGSHTPGMPVTANTFRNFSRGAQSKKAPRHIALYALNVTASAINPAGARPWSNAWKSV